MEAYKKLQEIRDKFRWTDDELVQFVTELNTYTEEVLGVKNEDSSFSEKELFVRHLLKRLGIPANIKGYHYLVTAILLILNDNVYLGEITKGLYPEVAKMWDSTGSKVERAMRHAIESGIDRGGNAEFWNEIMVNSVSYYKGKPTNSEFLATICEYIEINLPKWRSGN